MSTTGQESPKVLIVGAGLGGLTMALLLEKMKVPYYVFERATTIRPLGSILSFNANILALIEQLGLLEELQEFSKVHTEINIFDTDSNSLGVISVRNYKEITGYNGVVFARPDFHKILLSKIPPEKVKFGKRILEIENKDDEVTISCADGSVYRGDILVGADGAYSSVRQNMYQKLATEKRLPKSDGEKITIGYLCIVGVTEPLQPDRHPKMREDRSHFIQTLDKDSSGWHITTLPGNRIGWGLTSQFTSSSKANDHHFRNSEWAPESNEAILKRYRDSTHNFGGTMGEIFDATPKEVISTVYLEEKLFETWHHGRTVLIGDACHKMLPQAGQGAMNAMQDAVILANAIYELVEWNPTTLKNAFQSYQAQRYMRAKDEMANSKFVSRLMSSQQWLDKLIRTVVFKHLPVWVTTFTFTKAASYRPQAVFLPLVESRGTGPVLPQKPSKRAQAEAQRQKQKHGHGQEHEREQGVGRTATAL